MITAAVAMMTLSMMASVRFEICKELSSDRPGKLAVCAGEEATRMVTALEARRTISIVVQPDAAKMPPAPKDEVTLAFTDATIGDENGCTLTFYKDAVTEIEIIAHEVCHCVADRKFLTPGGYARSVSDEEIVRMEAAAETCAGRLVEMTKDPSWGEGRGDVRRPRDARPPLTLKVLEVRK